MGPSGPTGAFSPHPLQAQGDNSAHATWAPAWAPSGPLRAPAWAPLGPGGRLLCVPLTDLVITLRLGTVSAARARSGPGGPQRPTCGGLGKSATPCSEHPAEPSTTTLATIARRTPPDLLTWTPRVPIAKIRAPEQERALIPHLASPTMCPTPWRRLLATQCSGAAQANVPAPRLPELLSFPLPIPFPPPERQHPGPTPHAPPTFIREAHSCSW